MSVWHWLVDVLFRKSDESLSFLLLFLVILLFVVYPFFPFEGIGRYAIDVFTTLVLISSTFAVERRTWRRFALALAGLTLLTRWATYASPSRELLIVHAMLGILFLTFASAVILGRVFAGGPVTRHRIEGAVAVYLLIGLAFGSLYALIALLHPGAFEMANLELAGDARGTYDRLTGRFSYFSFVTLTTVGYGDVTPLSPVAKQFAVLEGLIGQLYPAILLARLVSMELAGRREGT